MIRISLLVVIICVAMASLVIGQGPSVDGLDHVTLFCPFVFSNGNKKPDWDKGRAAQSCLDVTTLKYGRCPATNAIGYGNRIGVNIDIFTLDIGRDSQSRILDLGKHEWNDGIEVPYVRPYAPLRAGETRKIIVNASGNRAPDGNTYGNSTIANQVKTARVKDGSEFADNYAPNVPAELGHMYVVRVLDASNDYYFLLRVDRVDRGTSVDISFKKVPSPTRPVF